MGKQSVADRSGSVVRAALVVAAVAVALLALPATFGRGRANAAPCLTTLKVTTSPNPSSPYGFFNITATATCGGGNPPMPVTEGGVTFKINGTQIALVPVDGSGHATREHRLEQPGTFSVEAEYGGSVNYTQTKASTTHAVTNWVSETTLSTSPNPSTASQEITATATVTPAPGGPGGGFPIDGGTVDFRVNGSGTPICSGVALDANKAATCAIPALGAGTHSIVAYYSGSATNAPSTSNTVTQTVLPLVPTSTALAVAPDPPVVGNEVTFTATVTAQSTGLPVTEGTVDFSDANSALCSNTPVNGSGVATCKATFTVAGFQTAKAAYSGSLTYAASRTEINVFVKTFTTTTSLASNPNPSKFGQPVTFAATVRDQNGAIPPGGDVEFYLDGLLAQTTSINANGLAALTKSDLAAGDHTVVARYLGTTIYDKSDSSLVTQTVTKVVTTTVLTSSQNPAEVGTSITFTATVTGSPVTEGSVVFTEDGVDRPPVPVDANGQASYTTNALTPGTHTFIAKYTGTANYGPSMSPTFEQTINKVGSTTAVTSDKNPSKVGETVTFTATLTTSFGSPTSGTVTFRDGPSALGPAVSVDPTGKATITVSTLTGGSHTITAEYSGTAFVDGSTGQLDQTVDRLATTTALASSSNPSNTDETTTFTATVTSGGAPVTEGTATFVDNGEPLCSEVAVTPNGTATCTTGQLGAGTHTITASYNMGPTYDTSSADLVQSVNAPAPSPTEQRAVPTGTVSKSLARTGADLLTLVAIAFVLISVGAHLRWSSTRILDALSVAWRR